MDDRFVLKPSNDFERVNGHVFRERIVSVRASCQRRRDNLTLYWNYNFFDCWLAGDGFSGFAITKNDELVNLFSMVSGGGNKAIACALKMRKSLHLNCFEGPLVQIYMRHGFWYVRREKNWSEGGPDIIYMRYQSGGLK